MAGEKLNPEHVERAARELGRSVRCACVTISDSRTRENDTGGDIIEQLFVAAGHELVHRELVRDEPDEIAACVERARTAGAAVLVTTGGTGISKRDSTFDAIDALLEKRLPGFGELFRALSFPEIGPAALLSRASAGTVGELLVFCLPGSPHAVRLGLERLIVPDLAHLAWETVRR